MKITIVSTDTIVRFQGVLCRLWLGHDEAGQQVQALVAAVGVPIDGDRSEAERDLNFAFDGAIVPAMPQHTTS